MKFFFPSLAGLAFALASSPSFAANITSFNYGGSGCPQGSVTAVLAPDGSALSILYSAFAANVNGQQTSDGKDCTVELKIAKPVLQALVLDSADFRGFVGLEPGVTAQQQIDVQEGYGQFLLNQRFGFNAWAGPVSQNYMVSSVKPVTIQGVGSAVDCANQLRKDTKLVFKTRVNLQSRGGQGMFTVDSTDGHLQQIYRFRLVNCLQNLPLPFPFPFRR